MGACLIDVAVVFLCWIRSGDAGPAAGAGRQPRPQPGRPGQRGADAQLVPAARRAARRLLQGPPPPPPPPPPPALHLSQLFSFIISPSEDIH